IVTSQQLAKLKEYATQGQGGYESLCARVADNARLRDRKLVTRVYAADLKRIDIAVQRDDEEIMKANAV
ncbi:MAG: hypothetical protein ACXWCX_02105, partial [Burkholderiales bacterium]